MVAGLLVITFLAGYLTGFSVSERRWKRSAFEALNQNPSGLILS
jgi:hypothetical protein